MSETTQTPENIWIITEETSSIIAQEDNQGSRDATRDIGGRIGASVPTDEDSRGSRNGSRDIGGIIDGDTKEIIIKRDKEGIAIFKRKAVQVTKLKEEMKSFMQAMREMLDEAEEPNSKMQLDEVELSVEINGEGQISLLGIGGGKAGGKGAMTFKFKRK
ncbi:hypothetical protein [Calothrix sp. CCY 0018]|uniref:Pepco domain-containing protein n=1 Tax=Calothrix sp. CCY 0018 TaxID=3103864 RepID=UPI0039C72B4B